MKRKYFLYLILVFVSGLAAAGDIAKLKELVGEWVSDAGGEIARIIIREDGDCDHSKHGRCDIEHENGKRYKITVYNGNGNYVQCQVLVDKLANGDLIVTQLTNPNIGGLCDWGRLSPVKKNSFTPSAPDSSSESAPETSR